MVDSDNLTCLLKMKWSADHEEYHSLADLTISGVFINAAAVDDIRDVDTWSVLAEGADVTGVKITAYGPVVGSVARNKLQDHLLTQAPASYYLAFKRGMRIYGEFKLIDFKHIGQDPNDGTGEFVLESSGRLITT